jgi:acetyltransferase-like isoleucine patch superfamily enzyme
MQDRSTDRAHPIAVFGGPGAGALAAFTLRRIAGRGGDLRFVGFLNDLAERGTKIAGEPVVDPDAAMADDVEHGPGLFVAAHATVMPGTRLGAHVAVRGGGYVGHDAVLDDYAFVGANAVVCGYVRLEAGAHVAPGALVREGTRIGRYAVIGLGAVVVHDVPDYAVMVGNPARMIGELEGEAT